MDSGACRDSLATLLAQEASSLDELSGLLQTEHGLLVANDVDALDKAMQDRQAVVGRLLDIDSERRSVCRMHGHTADAPGLEKLMAWCDPNGTLKPRWSACERGAIRCRELNDRNGALVMARMRRVQTLLGAITGQAPETPSTYGPRGAFGSTRSGRVFSTEV